MDILASAPDRGNSGGPFALRTQDAPEQPPPTLAEILADPGFSDRAKRLAEYLDGCCRSEAKWAAWPKVSTIAACLGWDGTSYGGRKRVERGFHELVQAGALRRVNLGGLVEWFDAEGAPMGLAWPDRLPRGLRRSLKVCVLAWRIPGASGKPPILPRCDTGVASKPTPEPPPGDAGVACPGTQVSHGAATEVSHPSLNVRSLNGSTEPTLNGGGSAGAGDGGTPGDDAGAIADPVATGEPTAVTVEARADGEIAPAAAPIPPSRSRVGSPEETPNWLGGKATPTEGGVLARLAALTAEADPGSPEVTYRATPPTAQDPAPGPSTPAAPGSHPARPVPRAVKADLLARIGRLPGHPDRAEVAATARALAAATGPHRDEGLTVATLLRMAGEVCGGGMPVGWLIEAFEEACGRSMEARGAVFIAAVKRRKGEQRRQSAGGRPLAPECRP